MSLERYLTYHRMVTCRQKMEDSARTGVLEILAQWDGEAGVWVAESDDVPGLVAEADSPNVLAIKLKTLIPELLELNGARAGGPVR